MRKLLFLVFAFGLAAVAQAQTPTPTATPTATPTFTPTNTPVPPTATPTPTFTPTATPTVTPTPTPTGPTPTPTNTPIPFSTPTYPNTPTPIVPNNTPTPAPTIGPETYSITVDAQTATMLQDLAWVVIYNGYGASVHQTAGQPDATGRAQILGLVIWGSDPTKPGIHFYGAVGTDFQTFVMNPFIASLPNTYTACTIGPGCVQPALSYCANNGKAPVFSTVTGSFGCQ